MLKGFFDKYVMGSADEHEEEMEVQDNISEPRETIHPPSIASTHDPGSSAHSLPTFPRRNTRAESILRFTIRKMRGRNKGSPGGATARSLTDLICLEYGWPKEPVRERVDRALKRAVQEGRAEVCGTGKEQRYVIAHGKMKECLEKLIEMPVRKGNMMKDDSEDLRETVNNYQKKRRVPTAKSIKKCNV